MRCLVVITIASLVACVQCLNLEQRDLLLKRKEFCMEITKVDPSLVRKLSRTNFRDKDSPLGRFVHCLLVQSDLMSNEGILKFDVFLNKIPGEDKDLTERHMIICMNSRGNVHRMEDRAVLFYQCFKAIYPDDVYRLFL